ncbi:MAG: MarR family winged helix-turn-helix transcriptional regulator [Flavobacteriaceae bacterium]
MKKSVFDPREQEEDVSAKIVIGLERISQAFKVLLWDKAKTLGLSPIQIQILIFLAYHNSSLCHVSYLAKEFNVTKPTISDAIRVLEKKGLILKDFSSVDNRSYTIVLTPAGKKRVGETEDFMTPLTKQVDMLGKQEKEQLFNSLGKLIYQLNQNGVLTVQRTCFACKYYQEQDKHHFCNLLKRELMDDHIRLDCPEFQSNGHH